MKKAILDSDTFSYFFKEDSNVMSNALQYMTYHPFLTTTSINFYEMLAGLEYKKAKSQIVLKFERFIASCEILPLTISSLRKFAEHSGRLRRNGITIGTSDLLIAGIAIDYNLPLITNNTKHFKHIPELTLINWKSEMS